MQSGNPLYFGNYQKVSRDTYERSVLGMRADPDAVHQAIIRDTYYLGSVLVEKRNYLRASVWLFVLGLTGGLLFAIAIRINAQF